MSADPVAPLLPLLTILLLVPSQASTTLPDPPAAPLQSFEQWRTALIEEALGRGYSETIVEETLADLQPLVRVIEADRSQAELHPGFGRYLATRLTPTMVTRGRELARRHDAVLARIERDFDVPRRFVLAIWGLETRYGRVTGSTPVFQALATLAWEPRRADFFRGELFDALTMVQRGHINARTMTGSWAGAMGQTQFMPSSYLKHAVDFDGDGRRDIWNSTADALASIASYLRAHGWTSGFTWGREVHAPLEARAAIGGTIPKRQHGCFAERNMTERFPLEQWTALGVRRIDGGHLPSAGVAAGLVDVGERTFLVYPNYDALLGYNCAHYYALAVALLADKLR
jgi:membrane-bound lytic murein transglycosylase B